MIHEDNLEQWHLLIWTEYLLSDVEIFQFWQKSGWADKSKRLIQKHRQSIMDKKSNFDTAKDVPVLSAKIPKKREHKKLSLNLSKFPVKALVSSHALLLPQKSSYVHSKKENIQLDVER